MNSPILFVFSNFENFFFLIQLRKAAPLQFQSNNEKKNCYFV